MRDSNKKSRYKQPLIYASMLLLGVILGAWAVVSGVRSPNVTAITPLPQVASISPAIAQDDRSKSVAVPRNYVVDAVNRTGPAVVRINASRTVSSNQQIPEALLEDPMFRQFFGDQLRRMPRERVERGTGSGFIINKEGDIITNAHVVSGADKVTVILKDGRQIEGKVLGSDELTDIAVVQVKADNLPVVSLGSSESLQPGDWAIAIGNPLGLDNTVTAGIVSAIGRNSGQIGVADKRVSFIQTDAAINPGNSGGPLLNQNGEVVGVNTAIIQGAQGLGFSIPIETAQRISKQIIQTGKVSRAYLGIQMINVDANVKRQVNQDPDLGIQLSEDKGVLITRVVDASPAAKAGAKKGDLIVKLDNREISTADQVTQIVESRSVGDRIQMEIRRNGQPITLNVETEQFPQKFPD
ncbi:MAG: serine protease [Pseudanabaena sp.]|nr:MAG: serine protease [Pseudanabaena sp.]